MKSLIVNNINDLTNTLKTMNSHRKQQQQQHLHLINESSEPLNDENSEDENNEDYSVESTDLNSKNETKKDTNLDPNNGFLNMKLDHLSNILIENVNSSNNVKFNAKNGSNTSRKPNTVNKKKSNTNNSIDEEEEEELEDLEEESGDEIEQELIINPKNPLPESNINGVQEDEDQYVVENFEQTYTVSKAERNESTEAIGPIKIVTSDPVDQNVLNHINIESMNLNDTHSIRSNSSSMSGMSGMGIGDTSSSTTSHTSSTNSLNTNNNNNNNLTSTNLVTSNVSNTPVNNKTGVSKTNLNTELYYPSSLSRPSYASTNGNNSSKSADATQLLTGPGMFFYYFYF
jgi:hypothetical protein